jgi:WD40 repeat protein
LALTWKQGFGVSFRPFKTGVADIRDMIFSPDGKEAVLARGYVVELYNLRDGAAVPETLKGHQMRVVFGLTFSQDGQYLATTSADGMVRVWRVSTGDVALSIAAMPPAMSPTIQPSRPTGGSSRWATGSP